MIKTIFAGCLYFLTAALYGQDTLFFGRANLALEREVQRILEEGIEAKAFPGAQVLVAHKGEIVLHQAAGFHTYQKQRAVGKDDLYDLASVTKASSALLVLMQQYERNILDLDAPLADIFPLFKGTDKAGIPLRDALAHQARLRPWVPYWQSTLKGNARYPWRKKWDGKRTNEGRFKAGTLKGKPSKKYNIPLGDSIWQHRRFKERYIYRAIKKSPLEAEAKYQYSGLIFYLLPDYVSRSTGQEYTAYLEENFYAPLGATTLTYRPLDKGFSPDQIVPTERDTFFRHQLLHGVVHDEGAAMMEGVSANAGLFSSALDLAKLWQMLVNGGHYGGRRYFQEATVRAFTRVQFPHNNNHRGLGFDKPLLEYNAQRSSVAKAASPNSFGHSGYTGTFVWADPEHDLVFVFMSNRVHPSRNSRAIYDLNIRPRIMTAVYSQILGLD